MSRTARQCPVGSRTRGSRIALAGALLALVTKLGRGLTDAKAGSSEPQRGPVKDASGGRYWVRTSDLFGVNEARYHCANRPGRRVCDTL